MIAAQDRMQIESPHFSEECLEVVSKVYAFDAVGSGCEKYSVVVHDPASSAGKLNWTWFR